MMRDIYANAAGVAVWPGELDQLAAGPQSVGKFRSLFRLMRVAERCTPSACSESTLPSTIFQMKAWR